MTKVRDTSTPLDRVDPDVVAEALGAEPCTYFPPMWLHNRAIVRRKGTQDPPFVLYRLKLGASREESTACLLAVEHCAEMLENQAEAWKNAPARDAAAIKLPLAEIEERFEPTGKVMSVLRAPL